MSLPCVILAGGAALRMRPLTDELPKVLLPVCGRPFADLQLEWLHAQGVEHVVYSIGYLGDMVRRHVGDGGRFGMRVDYVDEGDARLGTGGALRLVVDSGLADEELIVLNGDSYLRVDLPHVERAFAHCHASALMTVLHNRNRWDASNVVFRDGCVILYDKRRPSASRSSMEWIDYGLTLVRAHVIAQRIPPGAVADLADVMHDLSVQGELAGLEVTERFYEIGSPQGLADLEAHLAEGEAADANHRPARCHEHGGGSAR